LRFIIAAGHEDDQADTSVLSVVNIFNDP